MKWALLLCIRETASPPTMVTDCLGLLRTAEAGAAAATSAKKANARVWSLIAEVVEGRLVQLSHTLTWMPAHTTCDNFHSREKSTGSEVTTTEWRANQLACPRQVGGRQLHG